MLRLLVLLALTLGRFSSCWGQNANYSFCGDCHCINGEEDCPTGDQVPQMNFSPEYVSFLQSLEVINPYSLSCNPYTEEACETTPPQNMTDLGDAAACGVKYNMTDLTSGQCPTQYSLETYASQAEAEADGAQLTHHGACGVCSTTQDLAVYIEFTDLVDKGTECSVRGIIDEEDGVACYTEVGYTEVGVLSQSLAASHDRATLFLLTSLLLLVLLSAREALREDMDLQRFQYQGQLFGYLYRFFIEWNSKKRTTTELHYR